MQTILHTYACTHIYYAEIPLLALMNFNSVIWNPRETLLIQTENFLKHSNTNGMQVLPCFNSYGIAQLLYMYTIYIVSHA